MGIFQFLLGKPGKYHQNKLSQIEHVNLLSYEEWPEKLVVPVHEALQVSSSLSNSSVSSDKCSLSIADPNSLVLDSVMSFFLLRLFRPLALLSRYWNIIVRNIMTMVA